MSAASAKSHEPSMEEILASIRRIIADDQDGATVPRDVIEDAVQLHAIAQDYVAAVPIGPDATLAADERTFDTDDLVFQEVATPAARSERRPSDDVPRPGSQGEPMVAAPPGPRSGDRLISTEATAAVGQAFDMLSHTILSSNARTLEDLVRELLKPMLKTWLDDNLPPLVERLVRAEIERVARGRG